MGPSLHFCIVAIVLVIVLGSEMHLPELPPAHGRAGGGGRREVLHELHISKEAAHWHGLVAVVVQKDAGVQLQGRRALLCVQHCPVLRGATAIRLAT